VNTSPKLVSAVIFGWAAIAASAFIPGQALADLARAGRTGDSSAVSRRFTDADLQRASGRITRSQLPTRRSGTTAASRGRIDAPPYDPLAPGPNRRNDRPPTPPFLPQFQPFASCQPYGNFRTENQLRADRWSRELETYHRTNEMGIKAKLQAARTLPYPVR
jgi:hypothetical protein